MTTVAKPAASEPTENNQGADSAPATARRFTFSYGQLMLMVLLAAFLIRVYRLADPFGGYHSFNEAHYTLQGVRYLAKSVGDFIVNPVDTNNPPLFSFLLYLVFRLFGVSEAAARLTPVLFSLVAVYFTYRLGALLYDKRAGILSALILAFIPGFVLVSRNVQTEAVYTSFILISLFIFISRGTENVFWAAGAGAVFGLGILTKMPTVVIMPALVGWYVWRQRRLAWTTFRPLVAVALGAFIAVWPYYGYQMLFNGKAFFASQGHLAGTISIPSGTVAYALFTDLFWLFSPLLFAGLLISIVWLLLKRSEADVFVLLMVGSYLGFFFFYHFHSYYVIPVAPFAALGIGRFLDSTIRDVRVVAGVAGGLTLSLIFFTFLMLGGLKYGRTEFKEVAAFVPRNAKIIETQETISGNYGPVLEYYLPETELRVEPPAQSNDKKHYMLLVRDQNFYEQAVSQGPGLHFPTTEVNRLVLFGYAFHQEPRNEHFFTSGPIEITKADPPMLFGWERKTEPWWLVVVDPAGAGGIN